MGQLGGEPSIPASELENAHMAPHSDGSTGSRAEGEGAVEWPRGHRHNDGSALTKPPVGPRDRVMSNLLV